MDVPASSEIAGSDPARRQDPIVERLRPDPAKPALRTTTLQGFLGNSEIDGYQRIYFTKTLDYYAEFRDEDVVQITAVPAEQSPFPGEAASSVELLPGVNVNYVRARVTQETAPFDLDIQPVSSVFGRTNDLVFTDSVVSPSCDIFDTSCGGAGCGDPNPVPTTFDCPVEPRLRNVK